MKLLAVFWASAAAIAACCVPPVSAFWRLNCPTPVTVQRADSIVSPGKPASHIHTVVGSSGFHASSTPASIRRAACSTCEVADDMSNYWVPNVYYQRQDGGFEYVTGGGILVYYLQRRATDAEVLRAFPDNLVMIAGDPKRTTYNASKLEDRAISFMCLNYANPNPEQHQWYTDRDCPQGLRAQIFFPSCWDGVNVDSADHKSHMAYPDGVDNGKCPPTHPVRLISIFFEIFFDITRYKDGWLRSDGTPFRSWPFLFSTGDRTGNSLHGDFMNGWNSGVLQQAIDNCTDLSGDIRKCGAFTFRPDGFDRTCQLDTPVVLPDEQVFGVLWDMPAHPELRNGAPRPAGPVQLGCYDDPAAPNRWVPAAQRLAQTNDMTPTKCIALAKEKNYTYAGLEYGTECYGGNTLPKAKLSGCNARCPGSTTDIEFCGGSNSLTLWQVTGPGTGPTVAPIDNNNQAGAAAAGACASNAVAIALTALIATVMKYTN